MKDNWKLRAACRGKAHVFFPRTADLAPSSPKRKQEQDKIKESKEICLRCPVQEQCRELDSILREPYGTWAGVSKEELLTAERREKREAKAVGSKR